MFCSACGANVEGAAKFCHACGAQMQGATASPPASDPGTMRGAGQQTRVVDRPVTGKNPVVAAILSAVIVGVGQFYNGDVKKGAIMLVAAVVFGAVTGGLLWLGVAVWSAVDAYQVANGTGKTW